MASLLAKIKLVKEKLPLASSTDQQCMLAACSSSQIYLKIRMVKVILHVGGSCSLPSAQADQTPTVHAGQFGAALCTVSYMKERGVSNMYAVTKLFLEILWRRFPF